MDAPEIIGRYALYGKIASGGMAAVHLGRLMGPVGFSRTVAIKRMHPQFVEDPEFVSMFLDEARLVARIRHPNVVPTLDVVATAGELFLVLEYVNGETLARLLRQASTVPVPVAVGIISGVLHGLHAAHEAKNERGEPLSIVHRDVSPQNVMVGVDGVPRVLDFGVAKAVGRLHTTREGHIKGKIAYMSPEQVNGASAERRSDIYAAAVVLWETLTGRRLFRGESDVAVLQQVISGRVDPPSRYARDVPPALDALVMQGLSRDPARRFATAREMASKLEQSAPVAIAPAIGAWVEQVAGDALAEKSAQLAEIESLSGASPGELRSSERPSAPSQPLLPAGAETGEATILPELSSISVATPSSTARASRMRRLALVAALSLVAVGVVVLALHSIEKQAETATPPLAASAGARVERVPRAVVSVCRRQCVDGRVRRGRRAARRRRRAVADGTSPPSCAHWSFAHARAERGGRVAGWKLLMARRTALIFLALAALVCGCNAILGIQDLAFYAEAGGGHGGAAGSSAAGSAGKDAGGAGGVDAGRDAADADAAPAVCGDGIIEPGEQCDSGADGGTTRCSADCKVLCPAHMYVGSEYYGQGFLDSTTLHCYAIPNGAGFKNWNDAAVACGNVTNFPGGHLATVTSAEELDFLRLHVPDGAWLGALRQDGGPFQWIDNEPWSFTSWGSASESTKTGCLELAGSPRNFFVTDCTIQQSYVCEWEPQGTKP